MKYHFTAQKQYKCGKTVQEMLISRYESGKNSFKKLSYSSESMKIKKNHFKCHFKSIEIWKKKGNFKKHHLILKKRKLTLGSNVMKHAFQFCWSRAKMMCWNFQPLLFIVQQEIQTATLFQLGSDILTGEGGGGLSRM